MYQDFSKIYKWLALMVLSGQLVGCLGGTVAQQIARTIATSVADKAVGDAVEAQEKKAEQYGAYSPATSSETSDLQIFIARSEFNTVNNQTAVEPLPPTESETAIEYIKTNALIQVELLNLLVGEEKKAVLEKARLMGALNLPQPREWPYWHVAVGQSTDKQLITFLIPPHFGKLPSGTHTMVEIAETGNLNVARYKAN